MNVFHGAQMRRRAFMAAATAGLAAPAISRAQNTAVLRFVPFAAFDSLDPIWTTAYFVRNPSLLIYDTLYGINSRFEIKPQMVEQHDVSPDGLTYSFKLRPHLRWHDGEPVRAGWVSTSTTWLPTSRR